MLRSSSPRSCTVHQHGRECVQPLTTHASTRFWVVPSDLITVLMTCQLPPIAELFSDADDDLFHRINTNSNHVLQPYLPGNQLRTNHHNRSLIIKTNYLNNSEFIVRMLHKYSYWMFLLWTVNITYSLPKIGHWQYLLQFHCMFYVFANLLWSDVRCMV